LFPSQFHTAPDESHGVATVASSRWEGEIMSEQLRANLASPQAFPLAAKSEPAAE
jgi:hypothetical protein